MAFFQKPSININSLSKKQFLVNEEMILSLTFKGIFFLYINEKKVLLKQDYLFKFNKPGDFKIELKGVGLWGSFFENINIVVIDIPVNGIESINIDDAIVNQLDEITKRTTINFKSTPIKYKNNDFEILSSFNSKLKNTFPKIVKTKETIPKIELPIINSDFNVTKKNIKFSNDFEHSKTDLQQQLLEKYKL